MAYLVLGLGVVMAAIGGYAIANGYPIIQVERGWASVIAGAALLAGGVVTLSIGIVVRSLLDVKTALLAAAAFPARGARVDEHAEPAFAVPVRQAAGLAMPMAVAAVPVSAVAAMDREHSGAYDHHERGVPAYEAHEHAAPDPAASQARLEETMVDYHDRAPAAAPAEAVDDRPVDHSMDRHPGEPGADGYALETPSTPEHDLPMSSVPGSATPVSTGAPPGDWLDRAFSELDLHVPDHVAPHEMAAPLTPAAALEPEPVPPAPPYDEPPHDHADVAEPQHAEPQHAEPQHAELQHAELQHAELHEAELHAAEHEPAEHQLAEHVSAEHPVVEHIEDAAYHPVPAATDGLDHAGMELAEAHHTADALHHDEAVPAVHAEAVPEPPVIGRYEADGTSYTMYADGSIAAQSSAGVYRFKSMAELKAFIEG